MSFLENSEAEQKVRLSFQVSANEFRALLNFLILLWLGSSTGVPDD